MDFFATMESGLDGEFRELSEEMQALQATRRNQKKINRAGSFQHAPEARSAETPRASRCGGSESSSAGRGSTGGGGGRTSCKSLPPSRPRYMRDVSEGADLYLREWALHDQAWTRFQDRPPFPVSVGSVPWPPCNDDVLEFCERLQAPGQRKLAYRIACRRWHPDKFLQHYGSLVYPDELPGLTSRINEVFQAVTSQWERRQPLRAPGGQQ